MCPRSEKSRRSEWWWSASRTSASLLRCPELRALGLSLLDLVLLASFRRYLSGLPRKCGSSPDSSSSFSGEYSGVLLEYLSSSSSSFTSVLSSLRSVEDLLLSSFFFFSFREVFSSLLSSLFATGGLGDARDSFAVGFLPFSFLLLRRFPDASLFFFSGSFSSCFRGFSLASVPAGSFSCSSSLPFATPDPGSFSPDTCCHRCPGITLELLLEVLQLAEEDPAPLQSSSNKIATAMGCRQPSVDTPCCQHQWSHSPIRSSL